MRWELDINRKHKETMVTIEAPEMTEHISKLTTFMNQITHTLLVKREDEQINLDLFEIIYIENVERMTFIYTETDLYEVSQPLYELEEHLKSFEFIRINKQTLINPRHMKSVKALLNSRYELLMTSEEKLIVTRHYRRKFKALFTEGGIYDA